MPDFEATIDLADRAFKACWLTLTKFKATQANAINELDLLEFQPKLAHALFELDLCHGKLSKYRSELISHKTDANTQKDFPDLMRASSKGQRALRAAASVGRSIGDAFAWAFYSNSQDMLAEHFKECPIPRTPPGLGGLGELTFLNSVRSNTHFVLYHGITTFLRVGDVSFVELGSLRVTCLGELKTVAVSESEAKVTLHLLGSTGTKPPKIFRTTDSVMTLPSKDMLHSSPPKQWQARVRKQLNKQMKKMSTTLNDAQPGKLGVFNAYRFSELRQLESEIGKSDGAFQQVGRGVLITALRLTSSDRLFDAITLDRPIDEVLDPVRDITKHALNILDPNRRDNRIEQGEITPTVTLGFLPLFWWQISVDLLKEVYFRKLGLMTLHNPIFFLDKLRAKGFDISEIAEDKGIRLKVFRRKGDLIAEVQNFDFFARLISHHLMDEDAVVEMLTDGLDLAPSKPNTKVVFTFAHHP